jgi:hypothetical protein
VRQRGRHGDHGRAHPGERHVLLGIPRIALRADEARRGGRRHQPRDAPLEHLVHPAQPQHPGHGERTRRPATAQRGAQHLAQGIHEQQPEREVHDAVVRVALTPAECAEDAAQPLADGHLGVAVVRAGQVQREEGADAQV